MQIYEIKRKISNKSNNISQNVTNKLQSEINTQFPNHSFYKWNKDYKEYLNESTGEILEREGKIALRTINSLKYFNYTYQIDGVLKITGSTSKLNANYCQYKRNLITHKLKNFLISDLKSYIDQGYSLKHTVLTVPHTAENGYKGTIFYHSELLKQFNLLRKSKEWKQFFIGGFSSVETTYTTNGYHIHLHCLTIQRNGKQDTEARKYIAETWNKLTGSTITRHENLYKQVNTKHGIKKIYLNNRSYANFNDVIKALNEMIKYTIDITDESLTSGGYLIKYLSDTHYKRVFNRFGILYNKKQLRIKTPAKELHVNVIDVKQKKIITFYDYLHNTIIKYNWTKQQYGDFLKWNSAKAGKELKHLLNPESLSNYKQFLMLNNRGKPDYLIDPIQFFTNVEFF